MINKCLDRIRRDRRRPAAPLDNTAETIADAHEKSPEHLVIFDEKRIELILSIQSHPDLSDNSKTTLIQGYFFEKTDQEIADLLAQKPANIRLIRHRTLEKLRNDDDFCTRLRNLA